MQRTPEVDTVLEDRDGGQKGPGGQEGMDPVQVSVRNVIRLDYEVLSAITMSAICRTLALTRAGVHSSTAGGG